MTSVIGREQTRDNPSPQGDRTAGARVGWLLAFVAALLLYGFTASRTIGWQDSGQFVLRVVRGEVTDPFGLSCAHPLHFWLGTLLVRLLPAEPPFTMALVSSLFGAIAVANVYGIVITLTGKQSAALLAAFGLAVAHTYWRFSTFVEVYSISAAALTAEAWALVMWDRRREPKWLVLMFVANGLGLANHDLALLSLPVIGTVLLLALRNRQASWKTFVASGVAWFAGASIFLWMIVQDARAEHSFSAAIKSALFGKFEAQVLSHGPLLSYTAVSIAFTLLSFPNLMLPLAIWGVHCGRKIGVGVLSFWSLIAVTVIHLGFVLRYAVIDQYTFLMPVYGLIAVFSGVGFAAVLRGRMLVPKKLVIGLIVASLALTPAVYPMVTALTRHLHLLGPHARKKPYRDDYRYLFIPWGAGENSAQMMSSQAVDLASPDGVIITEDPMATFAIEYQRAMRHESGLTVADPGQYTDLKPYAQTHRPIVLVPYTPSVPGPDIANGTWERVGDLFVLELKASTRPADAVTGPQPKER